MIPRQSGSIAYNGVTDGRKLHMGDAGEGLVDSDARIQERLEELERQRTEKHGPDVRDPDAARALETLRLARVELERQLAATVHERRRALIAQALAEIDRRMAEVSAQAPVTRS